jgi:hypothetical protein
VYAGDIYETNGRPAFSAAETATDTEKRSLVDSRHMNVARNDRDAWLIRAWPADCALPIGKAHR